MRYDENDDSFVATTTHSLFGQSRFFYWIRRVESQTEKSALCMCQQNDCASYPPSQSLASNTVSTDTERRPFKKRRIACRVILTLMIFVALLFLILVASNRGFRRTIQFWSCFGPLVIHYRCLELWSYIRKVDETTQKIWLHDFHDQTAPKIVSLILRMGGVYVKVGQILSTVGQAILPDEYVTALQPLQDGVPPRSIHEIKRIIEHSTGQAMEDVFIEFEERPLGAASIAQAHKARLKSSSGDWVVVKVQYPEVEALFAADFANLELLCRLTAPKQLETIQQLKQRHANELDFLLEADHLRECRSNLRDYHSQVTIPRVMNETGHCTRHVLIMEFLDGVPLSTVIQREQVRLARAFGQSGDPQEIRRKLTENLREHFASGGGDEQGIRLNFDFKSLGRRTQLLLALRPVLGLYLCIRDGIEHSLEHIGCSLSILKQKVNVGKSDSLTSMPSSVCREQKTYSRVNVAKILKLLIRVHGLQMIRDGVYNADPHPGNILILKDGRLGLLDYGMIGRLSVHDRKVIAQVVLALHSNRAQDIADLYHAHGFSASFQARPLTDAHVLTRFARFHLDQLDFSPIVTETGDILDVGTLLRHTVVHAEPDWIVQVRRLSGLLMGVSAQAARPVSLANEWHGIARRSLL